MDTLQGFETWFFGSLISVILLTIGYFLKRNFERLEEKVDRHDISIADHETRIAVREAESNQIGRTLERTNELLLKLQLLNK